MSFENISREMRSSRVAVKPQLNAAISYSTQDRRRLNSLFVQYSFMAIWQQQHRRRRQPVKRARMPRNEYTMRDGYVCLACTIHNTNARKETQTHEHTSSRSHTTTVAEQIPDERTLIEVGYRAQLYICCPYREQRCGSMWPLSSMHWSLSGSVTEHEYDFLFPFHIRAECQFCWSQLCAEAQMENPFGQEPNQERTEYKQ